MRDRIGFPKSLRNWNEIRAGEHMLGRFTRSAAAFLKRDGGSTVVEVAVMFAMVLMALLTAVSALGQTRAGF